MTYKLPEGWERRRISEIGKVFGGSTPKTKIDEYWNGNIAWITPKDLSGFKNKYIYKGERSITKEGMSNSSVKLLPKGTVLFSSRAPIGYVAIAGKDLTTNQGFKNIVCDKTVSNNVFVYYLMMHNRKAIESVAGGSTFKEVSGKKIKEFEILLPPLAEQEVIAATLSALDDKIELNNAINENLEKQAQALFKHWFVDFEFPDENGNPYKSFGGVMVESELGLIPEGWEVGTIFDYGDIVGGSTPLKAKSEYYTDNGISWITPKDLSNNRNKFISRGEIDITELGYSNSSTKIMPAGTVLFSSRAPIGYIAIAKNEVTTNQGFKSVVPNEKFSNFFIYNFLKYNINTIINHASGSTFKEISTRGMRQIPGIIPNTKILKAYDDICDCLFDYQSALEEQIDKLSQLRDTLLPKLMSGKLRIPLEV